MRIAAILAFILIAGSAAIVASHGTPAAVAASTSPAAGWTIHIDALKHFKNHPDEVAHHWCRAVAGGALECQIYGSDTADAPMLATEMIVPTATWQTFSDSEKKYWHYHKTEIPKVSATMPDVSPDEAKAMVAKMMETYGKVYVLWDPMDSPQPTGEPYVNILN